MLHIQSFRIALLYFFLESKLICKIEISSLSCTFETSSFLTVDEWSMYQFHSSKVGIFLGCLRNGSCFFFVLNIDTLGKIVTSFL